MNQPITPEHDRLLELLATRAVEGLGDAEAHELAQLLARHPEIDPALFDAPAAGVWFEPRPGVGAPMPATLRRRLEVALTGGEPRTFRFTIAWLAAAAAVVLAVVGWWPRLAPAPMATPAHRRAALLASAPDARTLAWQDPTGRGMTGDIVWSDARNEGYMRFRGLAANDPSDRQYQLWIFQKPLPNLEEHPIDGGVFDVQPGDEVVVQVNAKLRVDRALVFAVTAEQPGGVVVSDRERIVALAN